MKSEAKIQDKPKEMEEDFLIEMDKKEQEQTKEEPATLDIVDDLFSVDDESNTKRNRKTKKTKEELMSFEEYIDFKPNKPAVEEENIINGREIKKKSRKSKKCKEVEEEVVVEESGEVDESLFEENIDLEEEKKSEPEPCLAVDVNSYEDDIEREDRYNEDFGIKNRHDTHIEVENMFEENIVDRKVIEVEDRYNDDIEEQGYHYDDEEVEYDHYDADIAEDISNVYIQEPPAHPVEPVHLISEYPDLESFRTPVPALGVDSSLIDSSLGLKKRKNKKKKR